MSIYNPAPLFVSNHTMDRTLSDVILDLQINWRTSDVASAGSVSQGRTLCGGTITSETATLTFESCSYYPALTQFSRTVTITLTDDLTEYEADGIYLVIRRPESSIQVTDIEIEPYLVMYPENMESDVTNALPVELNSSDSMQITATETTISVAATAPLVVLPETARKQGIRLINGLKPVNGDISINGLLNMQIVVGVPANE